MPTSGKSTIGKKLAKMLGRDFADTDDLILEKSGAQKLQDLVDLLPPAEFADLEQSVAINLAERLASPTIIATGGSMVYHTEAMQALKRTTCVIYLETSFETIRRRVEKKPDRGIVFPPGQGLYDIFIARMPLYWQWADETIDCDNNPCNVADLLAAKFRAA